ncbi:Phloem protein 2-like protein [Artemisia annua]|uniref:Phloem protein 2-like protein n=1 Tax=Artemisia annua TaxID=35608 RepID=A0A2U1NS37_ARTAN|nr:Phloem protein 2-like protein [Artemisia annua]
MSSGPVPSFTGGAGPTSFTGPPSFPSFIGDQQFNRQLPSYSSAFPRGGNSCVSGFLPTYNQHFPRELDHCRIPLEDIIQATNNFVEENIIEKDYCWTVYKGELSGKKLAFILVDAGYRLNFGLAVTLSSLPDHQNIVPFIGCCDEDDKIILVLGHPTRGSLDKYVSSAHLTWLMRVQICLDIASALQYLQNHSQIEELNSKCIHLDENWQAKIQLFTPSAFIGSSIFHRQVDPLDSFGEILFELLCGRLTVTEDEDERFLISLGSNHHKNGTLTELVDPVLRVQMNRDSFTVFSEIAYACLEENQDKRPTISQVVEELQKVLRLQQGLETSELQQLSYCNFLNVISYICLDEKQVKRPTNSTVVEELQKVLKLQQGFEISELQQVSYCNFLNVNFS